MFWICIMFPAIHKEALQLNNERIKLQWHPAFCAAARLEFNEDRDALERRISNPPLQVCRALSGG